MENSITDIIDAYLAKGFGSMNKNDFEVWIFHYLQTKKYKGKKDYEISLDLRIPITKVKRLRYEAELKYGNHAENVEQLKEFYTESFGKMLENLHFTKKGDFLMFVVEDIGFRRYIEYTIRNRGHLTDGSFSSDIITMNLEAFDCLLQHFWTKEQYEGFLKKAEDLMKAEIEKKAIKKEKTGPLTMPTFLKNLGKVFVNESTKEIARAGVQFTMKNLPIIIETIVNFVYSK